MKKQDLGIYDSSYSNSSENSDYLINNEYCKYFSGL